MNHEVTAVTYRLHKLLKELGRIQQPRARVFTRSAFLGFLACLHLIVLRSNQHSGLLFPHKKDEKRENLGKVKCKS